MRRFLVVVAAVAAACGDDGNTVRNDGGVLADARSIDAPADADLAITGSWLDRYITMSGTSLVAKCVAPTGVVIDQVTGAIATYPGACNSDGTFRIMANANLGTYYVRIGASLFETIKRAGIDLSSDHLGRADIAAIANASVSLNMTSMAPWVSGDELYAFAPNNGYIQSLNLNPAASATTVQGTAAWTGSKVDASKDDVVQIVQLGVHQTTVGLDYQTLDRAFDAPAFTMANNTTSPVGGAFTTTTTKSQQLRINVASFSAFASTVNPGVTTKTIEGTMYASPSLDTLRSPSLFEFSSTATGVTSLNFGTMSIVDPFVTAWQRIVRVQEAFVVPYTLNNVNGAMNAIASRTLLASTADTTIIDAILGPVTAPKFDGVDAFTATHISPVVKVSWSAPALGTPTDYEVQVYDVTIVGISLKFTSVLKMTTKQTAVRMPTGTLLGGRQYIFSIRSRIRENVDIYTQPMRTGDTASSAEVLTAMVTTDA